MKIDILTLFPSMFSGPFSESILKRAQEKNIIEINIHDLRKWTTDKHQSVDDRPFGGGVGMVLKVDVIDRAIKELKAKSSNSKVILLDAGGKTFTQKSAQRLSKLKHLIFVCGHYEGVDYRVHEHIADEIISIGDYIVTGGEIPALVIVDAVARLVPAVLVKSQAAELESFSTSLNPKTKGLLLEYPQYTRPEKYLEWKVPKVLLSGNHKEIDIWKQEKALTKTQKVRPDLIKKVN